LKKLTLALVLLLSPGAGIAGMKDGPCQMWDQEEADPYCASFVGYLPQYDEDFDIEDVEGRYALDCSKSGGIEVAGLGSNEKLELIYAGQQISDPELVYSFYGNNNPPVTFIASVMFDKYGEAITVNGDQYGFYIVEDMGKVAESGNGRRLSQCLDD